jgi:flavin-dependent dehydrogenase
MPYDLVIVGGGLAGSSLAFVMAGNGASVLVLEREQHFRDRIRGEAVHVWGTVETRAVGIHELLLDRCAHELGTYSGTKMVLSSHLAISSKRPRHAAKN